MSNESSYTPPVYIQVHGAAKDHNTTTVTGMYAQIRDPKAPELQIVRDHFARIARVAGNDKLSVQERVSKLTDLGKLYAGGYPFKNNAKLNALRVDNVPVLSRQAHAAADQLLSIEKAKSGFKDVGKMGNQE